MRRVTPDNITDIKAPFVFVFGSNESGIHGGGAANTALKWGAKWGQAEGLQGDTYAIPTKSEGIKRTLLISEIRLYVDRFIEHAKAHPEKIFLVTEIGCGLAGLTPYEVAPLFKLCPGMENVYLPERFWEVLELKRTLAELGLTILFDKITQEGSVQGIDLSISLKSLANIISQNSHLIPNSGSPNVQHVYPNVPFTHETFKEALDDLEDHGCKQGVIIIDSLGSGKSIISGKDLEGLEKLAKEFGDDMFSKLTAPSQPIPIQPIEYEEAQIFEPSPTNPNKRKDGKNAIKKGRTNRRRK